MACAISNQGWRTSKQLRGQHTDEGLRLRHVVLVASVGIAGQLLGRSRAEDQARIESLIEGRLPVVADSHHARAGLACELGGLQGAGRAAGHAGAHDQVSRREMPRCPAQVHRAPGAHVEAEQLARERCGLQPGEVHVAAAHEVQLEIPRPGGELAQRPGAVGEHALQDVGLLANLLEHVGHVAPTP